MCCTAILRTVSLSSLRDMALHMGIILDSSLMYVFILSRRLFSILLWFCLVIHKNRNSIIDCVRPSSDVALLPCRTELQLGSKDSTAETRLWFRRRATVAPFTKLQRRLLVIKLLQDSRSRRKETLQKILHLLQARRMLLLQVCFLTTPPPSSESSIVVRSCRRLPRHNYGWFEHL